MDLSLDQLRAFVAVVDAQGFTAAGRTLGRVQSAVSQAIATMEDQLGYPLFESPRRNAVLTPHGAALIPRVREVLAQYAVLVGEARSLSRGLESEVAIVFDSLFPMTSVARLSQAIAEHYPHCSQRLGFETLGSVVHQVREGNYPLGLVGPGGGEDPLLSRVHVGNLLLVPVAAPGHALGAFPGAIPLDEARRHRQIVFSSRDVDTTPDHAVVAHQTWRVADVHAKHELIAAGLGWGNLPVPMVDDDLRTGRLVRLALEGWGPQEHVLSLALIHRRDEPLGPIGRAVLAALRQVCT